MFGVTVLIRCENRLFLAILSDESWAGGGGGRLMNSKEGKQDVVRPAQRGLLGDSHYWRGQRFHTRRRVEE